MTAAKLTANPRSTSELCESVHTSLPASYLGTLLDGRYRLQRLIGEGASSWVFAALDQRLDREVALKLFKRPSSEDGPELRKRRVAEGHTLAKLVHPHIVSVHDASEGGAGQSYLVMELCEAGTLEQELSQRGKLALLDALELLLPLMGALACAHDRNVIHRDVKPANIVLLEENGAKRCKLLDFGISLGSGAGASSDLALGTPAYMAPEQACGEPATAASDVWALGVVFFRCLSGALPFTAGNATGVLFKIVEGRAPRFSTVCKELGPSVALALDRALEPDLRHRYSDMRSFARALASGCAQDRVDISARPEPIGLTGFEDWLASGAVETARALPRSRSPFRRVKRVLSTQRRTVAPVVLLSAALIALAVAYRTGHGNISVPGQTQIAHAARALEEPDPKPVSLVPIREGRASASSAGLASSIEARGAAREQDTDVLEASTRPNMSATANSTAVVGASQRPALTPLREKPRVHRQVARTSERKPHLITNWDW